MNKHRVDVDPEVYKALVFESLLRDITPKALVAQLIKECLSPESKKLLNPESLDVPATKARNPEATKKPRLADNPEVLQKIKDLWVMNPRPSYSMISKQTGYPRATVAENIKRMKARGEISD